MRWVALALILMAVPFLMTWLRQNPARRPLVWALMGFFPFVTSAWNLDAALISWALWPGHVTGIEITLSDSIALAVVLTMPGRLFKLPFIWLFLIYALAVAITIPLAGNPTSTVFYVWQILRVTLFFGAVTLVCMDERGPTAVLSGMALGLVVAAAYAANQKMSGALQASGTFVHQNLMGTIIHFYAYAALGVLLSARLRWMIVAGLGAALFVAIVGASRATIGFAAAGYGLTLLLSLAMRPTPRKMRIAGLAALALAISAPLAIQSLQNRFAAYGDYSEEYDERAAFEEAAKLMFADHPFGVGGNQYVVEANTKGYSARAGVAPTSGSLSTRVHNIYLLVLAETGFVGLLAFLALVYLPVIAGLRYAFRNRRNANSNLVLGAAVGIGVANVHGLYEWMLVTSACQYGLAISCAIIASQLQLERRAKRSKPEAPRSKLVAET